MIKEIIKLSQSTKKGISLYIMLQMIITFIFVAIVLNMLWESTNRTASLNRAVNNLYKITDELLGNDERLFFNQSDNVSTLKELYLWLNSKFDYIVLGQQNVYMEQEPFPDIFRLEYGEDIPDIYKSIQVNDYFFDHFSINVESGRMFEVSDYDISNEIIPILMGSEYKKYTNIHDNIEIYYCGKKIICEIIGYLEEGAFINNGVTIQSLDRYIIMPSLEVLEIEEVKDREQKTFALRVYLDKCSGFIASNETGGSIQDVITSKCYELDIKPFRVEGVSGFHLTMWGLEGEQFHQLLMIIAIIMLIVVILCTSMNMAGKILFLKKNISIYISNGLNVNTILRAIFLEIFVCNMICAMVGGGIVFLIYGNSLFIPLFLIGLIGSFSEFIYPAIVLQKINVSKTLRGDY